MDSLSCGVQFTYNGGGAIECTPGAASGACSGCPNGNSDGFKYISIQHGGTTKYLQYSAATDVSFGQPSCPGECQYPSGELLHPEHHPVLIWSVPDRPLRKFDQGGPTCIGPRWTIRTGLPSICIVGLPRPSSVPDGQARRACPEFVCAQMHVGCVCCIGRVCTLRALRALACGVCMLHWEDVRTRNITCAHAHMHMVCVCVCVWCFGSVCKRARLCTCAHARDVCLVH